MQNDYFLKICGIEGESSDRAHPGAIDVLKWSWAGRLSGLAPIGDKTGSFGLSTFAGDDFTFNTVVSKASLRLLLACITAESFPEATLTCRQAGGRQAEFLKLRLRSVVIKSFRIEVIKNEDTDRPIDTFALGFTSFSIEYRPQRVDGSFGPAVRGGFDFAQETAT